MVGFNPFAEVENLLRPFDRVLRSTSMPMDAYRRVDAYVIDVDLPGVDRDSIDVRVERNVLRITAERKAVRQEGDEALVVERPQGTVSRTVYLGQDLDAEHIEADYVDGVLTVTIPVAEQAKPRRIPIGTGTSEHRELTSTTT